MIHEQRVMGLPKGVRQALILDIKDETKLYPNEDFICSGKLSKRLNSMRLVDKDDRIDRECLERILAALESI